MLIDIDRVQLRKTADSVEEYLAMMKSSMQCADDQVRTLQTAWDGADYAAFLKGWEEIRGPDSVYAAWCGELRGYAGSLRSAEESYRKVQQDALERAQALLRA